MELLLILALIVLVTISILVWLAVGLLRAFERGSNDIKDWWHDK